MIKYIALILGMSLMAHSAIALSEGVIEIDTNGDGLMTIHEIQTIYPELEAEAFDMMDTNNDGVIEDSEMVAAQERGLIPSSPGG